MSKQDLINKKYMPLTQKDLDILLKAQKNEITEYNVYKNLSKITKEEHNKKILEKISQDELKHYGVFKSITNKEVTPYKLKIFFYSAISRFFGLTFGLRLMEGGEVMAQEYYNKIQSSYPQIKSVMEDEKIHEDSLIEMIDSKALQYTSAIILGLNDALVELSGALAGLTLALNDPRLIAITGTITGIAASMSMAASSYLQAKEENNKNPLKSAFYTGMTYFLTVIILVCPYLIFSIPVYSLIMMLGFVVLIIFTFNFYIAVAKNISFLKRFGEMVAISLGIATLNFFIGLAVQKYIGV